MDKSEMETDPEVALLKALVAGINRAGAALERTAEATEKMLAMDEDARRGYQQMLLGHNQ